MSKVTITKVDYADPDDSTHVTHVVDLSDGRTLLLWSGQASYERYDDREGPLVVGAVLTGVTNRPNEIGAGYHTVYHFSKA